MLNVDSLVLGHIGPLAAGERPLYFYSLAAAWSRGWDRYCICWTKLNRSSHIWGSLYLGRRWWDCQKYVVTFLDKCNVDRLMGQPVDSYICGCQQVYSRPQTLHQHHWITYGLMDYHGALGRSSPHGILSYLSGDVAEIQNTVQQNFGDFHILSVHCGHQWHIFSS